MVLIASDIPLVIIALISSFVVILLVLGYIYRTKFPMSFVWFISGIIFILIFILTDAISVGYTDALLSNETNIQINQTDNYAIFYPNANQYSQASGNTIYDMTTNDFSFIGMLKRTIDTGTNDFVFNKKSNTLTTAAGYAMFITSASDKLQGRIADGVTSVITPTITLDNIDLSKWYIYMFSVDNTDNIMTISMYDTEAGIFNTTSVDISTVTGSLTNAEIFTVASRANSPPSLHFYGAQDELQIFTTTALSHQDFIDYVNGLGVYPNDKYTFELTPNDIIGANNLINFNNPTYELRLNAQEYNISELEYTDIEPILYDIKVKDVEGNYTLEPNFIGIMLITLSLSFIMIGVLIERE